MRKGVEKKDSNLVNGGANDALGKLGTQGSLASWGLTNAGRDDVTEDDLSPK